MIPQARRVTKQISIGDVKIGGDAPVVVQSMTCTDTADVAATVRQIHELAELGCEVVRIAVPDKEAAEALPEIVRQTPVPLTADIHFDYRWALAAIKSGFHALRLNPGNIRDPEKVKTVVAAAKERGVPIRIGVNGGSLPPIPALATSTCSPPSAATVPATRARTCAASRTSTGIAWARAPDAASAPATAQAHPTMKPDRRPIRFISSEAGIVERAVPPTTDDTGRVASALLAARAWPTSAPMEIISEVVLVNRAWQAARINTLRLYRSKGSSAMRRGVVCPYWK